MTEKKSTRGFASMSPEKRKQIAKLGGLSVKPENRSFSKNRELAATAGRKGGLNVKPDTRAFSKDSTLAAAAGRKGGTARAAVRTQ